MVSGITAGGGAGAAVTLIAALVVAGFFIGCCVTCGPGFFRRHLKQRAPVGDLQVAKPRPERRGQVEGHQRRLSVRVASALGLEPEPNATEGGAPTRRLSTRVASALAGYPQLTKGVSSVAAKLGVTFGDTQVVPLAEARNEQVSLVEMAVEPDPEQQPPHGVAPPPRDGDHNERSRRTSGGTCGLRI